MITFLDSVQFIKEQPKSDDKAKSADRQQIRNRILGLLRVNDDLIQQQEYARARNQGQKAQQFRPKIIDRLDTAAELLVDGPKVLGPILRFLFFVRHALHSLEIFRL